MRYLFPFLALSLMSPAALAQDDDSAGDDDSAVEVAPAPDAWRAALCGPSSQLPPEVMASVCAETPAEDPAQSWTLAMALSGLLAFLLWAALKRVSKVPDALSPRLQQSLVVVVAGGILGALEAVGAAAWISDFAASSAPFANTIVAFVGAGFVAMGTHSLRKGGQS